MARICKWGAALGCSKAISVAELTFKAGRPRNGWPYAAHGAQPFQTMSASIPASPDPKLVVAPTPAPAPPGLGPIHATRRWLWWLLAWLALMLGVIGIVVPGLPTTPLVLLAAFAAARGSPRLEAWLKAHPRFGPLIRDWQAHGAVSRKAKWTATIAMVVCAVILWAFVPNAWAHWPPLAVMTIVAIWLWRRPEGPRTS